MDGAPQITARFENRRDICGGLIYTHAPFAFVALRSGGLVMHRVRLSH